MAEQIVVNRRRAHVLVRGVGILCYYTTKSRKSTPPPLKDQCNRCGRSISKTLSHPNGSPVIANKARFAAQQPAAKVTSAEAAKQQQEVVKLAERKGIQLKRSDPFGALDPTKFDKANVAEQLAKAIQDMEKKDNE